MCPQREPTLIISSVQILATGLYRKGKTIARSLQPRQQVESEVKYSESHSIMSNSLRPHRRFSPWSTPGQNTGMGSLSLLQGIFPTQGSNPGLPQCRQILYHLSHQGSPRILEWVAFPFSRGSSQLKDQIQVCCIADRFFTSWAIRIVQNLLSRGWLVKGGYINNYAREIYTNLVSPGQART